MSVNTELLKNRDFRNTLFAIGANQLSDSMSYITTPIIILALTGSPEAASITLFVAVFSPPAPELYLERGSIESALKVPGTVLYRPVAVLDSDSSLPRFQRHQHLRFGDHDLSRRHHFHLRLPE